MRVCVKTPDMRVEIPDTCAQTPDTHLLMPRGSALEPSTPGGLLRAHLHCCLLAAYVNHRGPPLRNKSSYDAI